MLQIIKSSICQNTNCHTPIPQMLGQPSRTDLETNDTFAQSSWVLGSGFELNPPSVNDTSPLGITEAHRSDKQLYWH